MKVVLLMGCILATVYPSRAQTAYNFTSSASFINPSSASPLYEGQRTAYSPYGLRMRNTGRTLTLVGGAMIIGGIIMINNAPRDYNNSYYSPGYYQTSGQEAFGALFVTGGLGMAIPGVIFWSKGGKKYKRYLEREAAEAASVRLGAQGLTLAYKF